MANIRQIKLDENNFVIESVILQELKEGFIEIGKEAQGNNIAGRKYDTETQTFLDEWLEGYEPQPEPLTEQEQMEIETYLNSCYVADMLSLEV